ncbi:MAG: YigZ family protein [Neptuniibacter sp.]
MKQFFPAQSPFIHATEVKRSKFITHIAHTPDKQSSECFIETIQKQHPKANHNCWARIAGLKDQLNCRQSNDDGEPKGTAGKPMLNVLEHSKLCEITVVVTRYFGGIKLGAGGLVRAYSQAVQEAIEILPKTEYLSKYSFSIELPFELVSDIERLITNSGAEITNRQWQSQLLMQGKGSEAQLEALSHSLSPIMHQISYSSEKTL